MVFEEIAQEILSAQLKGNTVLVNKWMSVLRLQGDLYRFLIVAEGLVKSVNQNLDLSYTEGTRDY